MAVFSSCCKINIKGDSNPKVKNNLLNGGLRQALMALMDGAIDVPLQ